MGGQPIPDFLITERDAAGFDMLKAALHQPRPATVAFVGAGFSRRNGYVSWYELVRRLAQSAGLPAPADNLDSLMETLEQVWVHHKNEHPTASQANLNRSIRDQLASASRAPYHDGHIDLIKVNFAAFLTTNFDPSLSLARMSILSTSLQTYFYHLDDPISFDGLHSRGIYYLHGRLWDDTDHEAPGPIVFLRQDYYRAYESPGRIREFMRYILEMYNVVFIGYGFRDEELFKLLHETMLASAIREHRQNLGRNSGPVGRLFRLVPIIDSDQRGSEQCQIDDEQIWPDYVNIHYKVSAGSGNWDEWGLLRLLEELAVECPSGIGEPAATTSGPFVSSLEPVALPLEEPTSGSVAVGIPTPPVAPPSLDHSVLPELEAILRTTTPSEEQVARLVSALADPVALDLAARVVRGDETLLHYWIPIFFSSRLLHPPALREDDPGADPARLSWYAGPLLEAGAQLNHPLVALAIQSSRNPDHSAIAHIIRAFLAFDDTQIVARLVPNVVALLSRAHEFYIDTPAFGNRLNDLVTNGFLNEAAQLLDALLGYEDSDRGWGLGRTATGRLSDFWLKHLVEHHLKQIAESNPYWLSDVLERKLREVSEWRGEDDSAFAPPAMLPSYTLHPVSDLGSSGFPHFEDILIGALRDSVEIMAAREPEAAAGLINRWLDDRLLIFPRLALHLLSLHPGKFSAESIKAASKRAFLERYDCYTEYWRFLHSQFAQLPADLRRQVENWILEL